MVLSIETPVANDTCSALLDGLVARTGYSGSDKISHRYCLAALSAITTGVNRLPSTDSGKGVTATCIGDGADDDNHRGAAVIRGRGRIESPTVAALHGFIGIAAKNNWSGRVHHSDLLVARAAVAASISSLPGSRRIKGRAAVTSHVGNCA